jgi:glycosyltransferase involved in cell wall biosynthesis
VLVEALATAPDELGSIVLAGPDAGAARSISQMAATLGVQRRVRILGAVSDGELAWLYGHASALAFPSIAEGFGLPLVEALAAGLPIVASDLAVLREVAGDCAVYVPPGEALALGRALVGLASDGSARRELADAGRSRAATFSWSAAAEATLECYHRALRCA